MVRRNRIPPRKPTLSILKTKKPAALSLKGLKIVNEIEKNPKLINYNATQLSKELNTGIETLSRQIVKLALAGHPLAKKSKVYENIQSPKYIRKLELSRTPTQLPRRYTSPAHKKALEYIIKNKGINEHPLILAEKLNVSDSTLREVIQMMKDKHFLHSV